MKLENMKLNQNKRPPDSERLLKKEQDGEQKKVYRPQQRKKTRKQNYSLMTCLKLLQIPILK
jgi:hypothetical protein